LHLQFFNVGVQHAQWGMSVADLDRATRPFAPLYHNWRRDNPAARAQLLQFGGVAVHGFREVCARL
jgi:hypothetical protein